MWKLVKQPKTRIKFIKEDEKIKKKILEYVKKSDINPFEDFFIPSIDLCENNSYNREMSGFIFIKINEKYLEKSLDMLRKCKVFLEDRDYSDKDIQNIRERFQKATSKSNTFTVGEKVEIIEGTFKDSCGRIVQIIENRVIISINVFGADMEVDSNLNFIKKLSN